ncbi:MAG: DUF2851 family protein [Candidatus Acetothermia bacterium]|jgi:hypothetical protein|nr:DUF2851 family protein [Candidatus Acetothermia bacterium]MDH7505393.1 DUF2851 family protein [Candidatus Acetothermia bacterium]
MGKAPSTSVVKVPEAGLRAFWASRLAVREYTSTDGRAVRVKFPGFENEEAGPDFLNGLIEVDGLERQGDIELHRLESDWQAHGHEREESYQDVILHVVFQADGPQARTLSGEEVVTISLAQNLGEHLPSLVKAAREEQARALPCPASPSLKLEELEHTLRELGEARLRRKAARFEQALDEHGDLDQVIYEGLAEALGYPGNKGPMRQLARTLTFARAREEPELRRLMELFTSEAAKVPGWTSRGMRPANLPLPRIRGLASLAFKFREEGLAKPLLSSLDEPEAPALLPRLFTVKGLIGPGRGRVIAVNVALPIGLIALTGREAEVLAAWEALPPEPMNKVLKRMKKRLLDHLEGGGKLLRKAHLQQGLIELYQRYCSLTLCEECPLVSSQL